MVKEREQAPETRRPQSPQDAAAVWADRLRKATVEAKYDIAEQAGKGVLLPGDVRFLHRLDDAAGVFLWDAAAP